MKTKTHTFLVWTGPSSLRSRRLEVVGVCKKERARRARGRHQAKGLRPRPHEFLISWSRIVIYLTCVGANSVWWIGLIWFQQSTLLFTFAIFSLVGMCKPNLRSGLQKYRGFCRPHKFTKTVGSKISSLKSGFKNMRCRQERMILSWCRWADWLGLCGAGGRTV